MALSSRATFKKSVRRSEDVGAPAGLGSSVDTSCPSLFTCVAVGLIAERRTVFDRRLGNFEPRFEEVSTTVESRSHGPITARCIQLAKVEVSDKNGFLV